MAAVDERLGDDADRIREVDDPGTPCAAPTGELGKLEDQRDRPERLGEAARAGRLLADDAECRRQRLVHQPSRLSADAQLDEHEVRAVDGRLAVPGQDQAPGPVEPFQHPAGEAADDAEPLRVGVEQDEFVDRQTGVRRANPSTNSGV